MGALKSRLYSGKQSYSQGFRDQEEDLKPRDTMLMKPPWIYVVFKEGHLYPEIRYSIKNPDESNSLKVRMNNTAA